MKRITKFSIAAILVMVAALISMSVFAAEYTADKTGKFTVTYTDGTAGELYSLVIVEGNFLDADMPELTESNIIYIDQTTAEPNGYVTFESFGTIRNVEGTVYLGGTTLECPIAIGLISSERPEFVYDDNGVVIEYNGLAKNVVVPDGVKKIKDASVFAGKGITSVRMPASIREVLTGLEGVKQYYSAKSGLTFDAALLGESYFIIGDLNNDGKVDAEDLRAFLANRAKGEAPADDIQSDYNGDGKTTLKDASDMVKDLAK